MLVPVLAPVEVTPVEVVPVLEESAPIANSLVEA